MNRENITTKLTAYKKFATIASLAIILITIIIIVGNKAGRSNQNSSNSNNILGSSANTTEIVTINREFKFPIRNQNGVEVSTIKYTIESAELTDEIVIQGQKATAAEGRKFLILNLKLTNDSNNEFQINSRDFIRVSSNSKKNEWLAADIHNDPVVVQPISTKFTRIGYPMNQGIKNYKLQVGEINEKKTFLDFSFK